MIKESEKTNIALDGVFDANRNSVPSSVGIIANSISGATLDPTTQTVRLTGVIGSSAIALDMALHDPSGNAYVTTNPLAVIAQQGSSFVVNANQSGNWFVGQSGPFNVGQTGFWFIGQSGPFNVGQTGNWFIGQSGSWFIGQTNNWFVGQSGPFNVGQTGNWFVGQSGIWLSRTLDGLGATITSTLVGTRQAFDISIVNRLPEVRNRTKIQKNINAVTTTTTIHTVTVGKTFFLTAISYSFVNSSAVTMGNVSINDNTTVVIPKLISASSITAIDGSLNMEENPPSFTTNVNLTIIAGTITASVFIIGYEE